MELKASQTGNHVWHTPFVVFLGAPHRGLDNKALQTLVMPELSKDIVDEHGEQSSTLTDLNENFAKIAHDLQIMSCYELRPTPTVVSVRLQFLTIIQFPIIYSGEADLCSLATAYGNVTARPR